MGQVADKGYLGVEPFGLTAESARMQAAVFADLGLEVPSVHSKLPLGDDKNEVLDVMGTVNSKRIVCPYLPPEDFATVDDIKRICERLNEACAIAGENGLSLSYHNHWWEFQQVAGAGKTAHEVMKACLDPSVLFQIDTYWVKVGGGDPAEVVRTLGSRSPLLHIKDGPANQEAPMTAVGAGVMDVPAIVQAGAGATEWLIVELDRCATDMMAAVKESYDYMIGEGLARGR